MGNFRTFPNRYWVLFHNRLMPKLSKLESGKRQYFEDLLLEIHDKFTPETFLMKTENGTEKPLNGLCLMGYHNQCTEINNICKD